MYKLYYFISLSLLYAITILTSLVRVVQPLSHSDESTALLQFKDNFIIWGNASEDPSAYPKVESWGASNSKDCCEWDGVECDSNNTHVVALRLNSSCLYGNITATLSTLSHLQILDLSDNHFNASQIPSMLGQLSRLTYLNLSYSHLAGLIPSEISHFSNLSYLDLSCNQLSDQIPTEISQLSHLTYLNLSHNQLSGHIPTEISQLSNVSYLDLSDNQLSGQIPIQISQLSHLSHLNLSYNQLSGHIPIGISQLTNLSYLALFHNNLSGEIPPNISELTNLVCLRLSTNNLHGEFPNGVFQLPNLQILRISINTNLTGSLPEFHHISPLTFLALAQTGFSGRLPSSMEKLKSLNIFNAEQCNFSGPLPFSFGKLSNLQYLNLYDNRLSGEIPCSLGNLSQLALLHLDGNLFSGPVPQSLSSLSNLESLILNSNHLTGTVDFFNMFRNMTNLYDVQLSYNNLTVLMETTSDIKTTNPMLEYLYLASCNLTTFPSSIRRHDSLKLLDLNANNIHGKVPRWIGNMSLEKLFVSGNSLSGFDDIGIFTGGALRMLDVSHNNLVGPLPVPPPHALQYDVSHNQLGGKISDSFCNLSSVLFIDWSHNRLSGSLPPCLRNLGTSSLAVIRAKNNSFSSNIPQMCANGSQLRMMDLSHNQFQGLLPRSLVNCSMLEVLNLDNNQLEDVFPSWLSTLSELRLLQLRSNLLHGAITNESAVDSYDFPSLRIIDVSHNNLSGPLPSYYIRNWKAMKDFDASNSSYLSTDLHFIVDHLDLPYHYDHSMTIANRGKDMEYRKIQQVFTVIDFSSNRFQGDIPECIGNLQGLQVLNLSNNVLIGRIPSSLGNIRQLESLDLSKNKLSGEIPQNLARLTFLAFFNVSFNRLQGPIPQGNQLTTFGSSSYEGNAGLWGYPLTKMLTPSPRTPPPPPPQEVYEQGQDSGSLFGFEWIMILPGLFIGLVVGAAIEHALAIDRREWYVEVSKFWS